jgi:DNA-directed RNA polymerase subunit RPC12/RpoP
MKNDERKNTKMMPAICTQCGGPVEVDAQRANAICQYCGSQIIVEKAKVSAVESVLSFVNDQQKRIDAVKKEKKEEERKAREEAEKSFKKYWWVYLLVMFILFGYVTFMAREEEKSDKISINNSSSELVGKNFNDVVIKLQENGFINIKTEAVEDLIIGLLTTDGEVEQVEIDGSIDFSSGTKFPKDAEIIVTYHTFPTTK